MGCPDAEQTSHSTPSKSPKIAYIAVIASAKVRGHAKRQEADGAVAEQRDPSRRMWSAEVPIVASLFDIGPSRVGHRRT